jgi:hypothetical protein
MLHLQARSQVTCTNEVYALCVVVIFTNVFASDFYHPVIKRFAKSECDLSESAAET